MDNLRESVANRVIEEGAKHAIQLERIIPSLIGKHGVRAIDIRANNPFEEVGYNAALDLVKLDLYHREGTQFSKFAGYVAFWVRKLKPITCAYDNDNNIVEDINEKLSVWLALELLRQDYIKSNKSSDELLRHFDQKAKLVLDPKQLNYIIHCMRARTFGPHHYVIMINMMIL